MSRTGINSCSENVKRQLAVICSFICHCNEHSSVKAGTSVGPSNNTATAGKNGGDPHRTCVDKLLDAHNVFERNSRILPAHPYFVPKEGEPKSLLPADSNFSIIRRLRDVMPWTSINAPQKTNDDYREIFAKYNNSDPRGAMQAAANQGGSLSIQDAVIVWNPQYEAHPANIQALAKVNFPPEDWTDEEYVNAVRIAGLEEKIHTLTPKTCLCNGENQNLDTNAGQAAAVLAAKSKSDVSKQIVWNNIKQLGQAFLEYRGLKNPLTTGFKLGFPVNPAW